MSSLLNLASDAAARLGAKYLGGVGNDEQHFGNEYYDYATPHFRVRFLKDRGQRWLMVGGKSGDEWENLSDIIAFSDPSKRLQGSIDDSSMMRAEIEWLSCNTEMLNRFFAPTYSRRIDYQRFLEEKARKMFN